MLIKSNVIPKNLLNARSTELYRVFDGPALLYFKGKKEKPLFLSCLIHGNEFTGLLALQELLKKYGEKNWPRSVYLFFGNISAAKEGRRHLDDQVDFNRIWKAGDLPENKIAAEVLAEVNKTGLFAAIDIHNNSGRNPLYSVVTNRNIKTLNLAALFSPLSMFFDHRIGSCGEVFADITTAVTLEAGMPGVTSGTASVVRFIENVLSLDEIPERPIASLNLSLMDTLATIKIDANNTVAVGDRSADIRFEEDFDLLNFRELPVGKIFGHYQNGHKLILKDVKGQDVGDQFLEYKNGDILTKVPLIPAMITLDEKILKSDCVCYLMKKLQLAS